MRCDKALVLGGLLAAAPLAAQDNPFAFTGGSVKSAYIVYEVTSKEKSGAGATYEIGVAPDRWIMKAVSPLEVGGKKDTLRVISVTTKDSQYTYNTLGSAPGDGEVSPILRPYIAKEYAGLDGAAKARFKENVKLAAQMGGSSDADAFVTLMGERTGSETVAGHKCDVYRTSKSTACVLPGAPMVMLRWTNAKDGVTMVAKKVTLNGPIPPATSVMPKGVKWKKTGYDDADFITNVWALKKESDPATAAPAALTQYVVRYLASPQAGAELREMGGGAQPGGDEAPAEGE